MNEIDFLFSIKMDNEEAAPIDEWQPLVMDNRYEINVNSPHFVRNRTTGHVVVPCRKPNGYFYLHLGKHNRYQHRIVAMQFIPNPDNLPQIHHRNFIRSDNRLENLEWISAEDNNLNKEQYRGRLFHYVDDIPERSVKILDYGNWRFSDGKYYFHADNFYVSTKLKYRQLHINENKRGIRFVNLVDESGSTRSINVSQLKLLYGLV